MKQTKQTLVQATSRLANRLAHAPGARTLYRWIMRASNRIYPSNQVRHNRVVWGNYDWDQKGDEWSYTPEWKASVLACLLEPSVPAGSRVLEIGPGAGRWTEHLVDRVSALTLVDLTPECIEMCRARFGDREHVSFIVNNGEDLADLADDSIDRIWSFDVFVHIRSEHVRSYVQEFARVLASGGRAVIHHSRAGVNFGWRSDMTAEKMRTIADEAGLEVIDQIVEWDEGRHWLWPDLPSGEGPDVISVLGKS